MINQIEEDSKNIWAVLFISTKIMKTKDWGSIPDWGD